MTFGERLHTLRKQRGWTLKEMSMRAEISISFLSDVERGKAYPTLEKCQQLADAFGMNASWLLSGVTIK